MKLLKNWIRSKQPREFVEYWLLRWRMWLLTFTDTEDVYTYEDVEKYVDSIWPDWMP